MYLGSTLKLMLSLRQEYIPFVGVAPTFTSNPSINGTPVVGTAITYTDSYTGTASIVENRQWNVASSAVSGQTNISYTPVAGDVGKLLTVSVTITNAYGTVTLTSAGVTVTSAASSPPVYDSNATLPGFTSNFYSVGQVAYIDFGIPTNGASSFTYQFYRNGVSIAGASGTTTSEQQGYAIVSADSGTVLSCQFTATNAAGSTTIFNTPGVIINVSSGATSPPVYDSNAILPGFVLKFYTNGQVATVDFGVPTNGATSFTYAFYRNGVAIAGASGTAFTQLQTYQTVAADSGTTLSCQFTAINSAGSASIYYVPGVSIA